MEQWYRDPCRDIKDRGFRCIPPEDVEGWEDVSFGCSGVFKQLITPGTEERMPKEGDVCACHLVGYHEDMEFENTRAGKAFPLEFHCGGGQTISGIEYGVLSMREGEVSRFIIDPIFAYREDGYHGHVPPDAIVEYEIELLSITREPTEQDKLDQATDFNEKGKALFKAGECEEARDQFKEAKALLGSFPWRIRDRELVGKQAALRIVVLANQVQCLARQERHQEVIKLAPEVFRFDKDNLKTLYRRAQAHAALSNFDEAHADIDRILALDPPNKDTKALLRRLQKEEAAVAQKQRGMYNNIWGGYSEAAERQDRDSPPADPGAPPAETPLERVATE